MISLPRNALVWGAAALAAASLVPAALPLARRLADRQERPPAEAAAARAPEDSLVEPILAWAPFGRSDPGPALDPVPQFRPQLTLTGVAIALGGRSWAMLARDGLPERSFALGEEVAPGVTLAAVHPDHVVLTIEGRDEELRFPNAGPAPPPQ